MPWLLYGIIIARIFRSIEGEGSLVDVHGLLQGKIDRYKEPFSIRHKLFWEVHEARTLLGPKFTKESLGHEPDGLIFQPDKEVRLAVCLTQSNANHNFKIQRFCWLSKVGPYFLSFCFTMLLLIMARQIHLLTLFVILKSYVLLNPSICLLTL